METNTVLNMSETGRRPSLSALISTDRKINALKEILRYDFAPRNMSDASSLKNINYVPSPMRAKVIELKGLSAQYNNGLITLDMYNTKLDRMLEYVALNGEIFQKAS